MTHTNAEHPRVLGGRYDVMDLIGRGGMARVYRARDRVLGRDVAVKVVSDVSGDVRDQFVNEARLLARLSHESIVTPYDAGLDDTPPWLVLELVEGQPLSQVLARGPLDPVVLARLATHIASGLAHAHAAGVVHQDVKPGNVMVTSTGQARLTDFGVARLMIGDTSIEEDGRVVGTAAYIAPEQLRGDSVTGAVDVYALGLLMLEALTGERTFSGASAEAAMARLHHGPLIPTSLPRGWPSLLASTTALDPDNRPSARDVASRLSSLGLGRTTPGGVDTLTFPALDTTSTAT
ncbi:Serine/threonine protein kinase [Nocardioides exalbidus]|uniref:Serine/threonine protein kinase n=1 Tax=Nocardioides exalbidus TaxID=402596 RepID=A0A1H4JZL3_9ACTN|nr:serine/threonine-protein kinase [Nocardioides exalbidus]SEB51741.1 Serine/threonine protein kinase [Nocardioides exalbidus]